MARNVFDRPRIVDEAFSTFVRQWPGPAPAARPAPDAPVRAGATLTGRELLELFESQMVARHLDLASRALRLQDRSYYTIGSAGHEGNAVVGRLTRPTDPAFLHYRSGAFMAERFRHAGEADFVYDTVLSMAASAEDPVSGGRHKIWGSAPLWVLPQTSTIASHLPKAVGTAIAIRRGYKLGLTPPVPRDSIVVCSFGDASVNHSTALGAISAAIRAAYQQVSSPILFVCEDNGIGISVRTPRGWVEDAFGSRRGLRYFKASGLDLVEAHRVASEAIEACREAARPVFLHLETVRLLGHAGTDVELEYLGLGEVEATERRDPLLRSASIALETGLLTPAELLERYEAIRRRVGEAAARAADRPRLASAAEIVAPLAPLHAERVHAEATRDDYGEARIRAFGSEEQLPERRPPAHLAAQLNRGLHDVLAKYPEALLFGEDVAQKGGVYHVSTGLLARFGQARVFNTVLDETTILGLAQGLGYMGMLPFPEIQYLAYFHNACDQLRGEACSMQFFSRDQFRNPMVLRIASLGYQKGFGGHFHNDNSIAALRDIPGLVVVCPSRADDAVGLLRTAAALAKVDGRIVAFLEPIALYMTRDLHEEKDGAWQFAYPPPGEAVPYGEPRIYDPDAQDLAIVTFGNGVPMSLRAARRLREAAGVRARVVDLRWLAPLNEEAIAEHAAACGRLVVVDEGRQTGGVGEGVVTAAVERCGTRIEIARVAGLDTYIPLGPAANEVLPSVEQVVEAGLRLARAGARSSG